ncbi:melanoma inhibitory activity protein 2 isoform X2 [Pleurodeles waltl]|uniref:melanoma inhibitory activity protein 2 isoform X2 n=1 Tax=Pleurodeles waltl TaxID=8319 RepID=UPI0037099FD9
MATRKSTTSQGPVRLLVIVLFFVAGFRGQKILSETKRCGDPGCESLMIRAQASRDYKGPDCRYLNFKSGEEILVYYKLSGKRDDLWQGSQGKKYGYFPKDAVKVEEVFISKEVEVPAMETDFICLDGGEYIFENEDSVLHDNDPEMEYMYPDIESYLTMPEGELLKPSSMSLHMKEITNPTAENYNQEATQDKSQSSGSSRVATKNSEHDPIEETEDIGSTGEPSLQEPINDAWSVSSFTGWLGMGGKQELKDLDPTADPLQENSFHSRKIALSDEINLGDSGEKELSWFGSGFSDYLPFGKTETEEILEEKHMITETETQDNTMDGDSENDAISIGIDPVTKKEEIKEPDSAAPGSNWLSLGLDNVLNLGQIITGTINKEEKQKDENIDWTDSSEPNLISDSLEPEIRTNHDENLNIDGSGADRMQNSEASSDYKELSYSDQASASKEISLSEEYEPKKGAEELSTPSWFKLGIEKILNLQESSKGNTIFKKEQTEVQIEIKEAPLQSAPVEAELGPISEDTAEMGSTVTEDTMNDQTDQLLKESKNPENNPLTAGLVSNNLQNILNLKMLTGTIDSPSAHDITYTEQPTEVYNGEKSLESQLPQHAAVEERTKEAESKWNKPGWYENMYGNIIGFHRHLSDRGNGQEFSNTEATEGPAEAPQSLSVGHSQSMGTIDTEGKREQVQREVQMPPSLVSINHVKTFWVAQSFTSKSVGYTKNKNSGDISEVKFQFENGRKHLQNQNGNDLKMPSVSHLHVSAPNHIDLSKYKDSSFVVGIQTDNDSGRQTVESTSVKNVVALPSTPLKSPVLQTEYVDRRPVATLTPLYPSEHNPSITERQRVYQGNIVKGGDHGSNNQQHHPSSNAKDYAKVCSNKDLNDNKSLKDQEPAAATSSFGEIPKLDLANHEDAVIENIMEVFKEVKASPLQSYELLKENSDSFLQCSALNSTFSQATNMNKEVLIEEAFHNEKKKPNYCVNPSTDALETSDDQLKTNAENMECNENAELNEAILTASTTEGSSYVDTLQTQESFHYDTRPSIHDDVLNQDPDEIIVIQSSETFVEERLHNVQISEDLFKSNTMEPYFDDATVRDILDFGDALFDHKSQKPDIELETSLGEEELRLQKQTKRQHTYGILSQDSIQKESSLNDLITTIDVLPPRERPDVTIKSYTEYSVREKEIQKQTSHIKGTCMPSGLDTPQFGHCSHHECIESIMSKRVDVFSREAREGSSDSYVRALQEMSNEGDAIKCSDDCLEAPKYSLADTLYLIDNSGPIQQYRADYQSESHDLNQSILITTETNVLEQLPMSPEIQNELFPPHQDNNNLKEENSLYYDTSVADSSLVLVEPTGQVFLQHKEDIRFEDVQRLVEDSDSDTVRSADLHEQSITVAQESDTLNHPSPPIPEQDLKMDQDLEGLHAVNVIMINAEQRDIPKTAHHHDKAMTGTLEIIDGSESNGETQEGLELRSLGHQIPVSPKGIIASIVSDTSGFFDSLFRKNTEANVYSTSTKTEVSGNHLNKKDDNGIQEMGEHANARDQPSFTDTDLTLTYTEDLPKSNVLKITSDNLYVGLFNIHEKVVVEEYKKDAENHDVISPKASSETFAQSVILNQAGPGVIAVFKEVQQLHSEMTNIEFANLGSICNKLEILKQNLEKVQEEMTTFSCENSFTAITQETVFAAYGNTWETGCKRWRNEEIKWLQTFRNLLSDIRLKCEAQEVLSNAESAMDEAPRKTSSEKNSFLSGDIDQKNEQSQQVNMLLSEDGAEKTHDSTFQLSANTTNDEPMHKQDAKENSVVENVQMGQQPDKDFTAAVDNQEDKYMLLTSNQGHRREVSSDKSFPLHPHSPGYTENALYFGVIQYLQVQDIPSHLNSIWSTLAAVSRKAVALLPEDLRPGPDLHGVSWEMVICAAFVGVFTVSLFLCQASKAIRSWRYVGREKELASKVAELVESKCKELEQLSIFQKQYEELEQSLQDASLSKESCETSCLEEKCQELNRSNSVLSEEIENLEKDLEEEKLVRSQQDNFIDEIQKRLERLEIEAKTIKSQADEARTTLKVFQINKGRLETALQDAKEEHIRFQESNEQLLQEAEGWGERFSELTEQTKMFESSKRDLEEALHNKESQVKSLTECLLTMKDWSLELGQENNMDNNNLEDDVSTQTENEELLDDHQKRTVKKLIYAAKLNASLKTLEEERNQLYVKLSDEVKSKEELAERIDHLQKEQNTLHSENSHFECDVQKLQQKLRVMTEMYQENELKLHRKLTVEEKDRLQKEEKLSKADEKIYHAAEELQTYRTRSKDLEEELEKTIRSYQSQIVSHEKKGHDNWLAARAAERHLNDIKKENAHSRQKLTEFEFKLELLEKDPYALDVPRMFGRENSPYGPSSLGRPSPETRAFLSPPTLLEGPLRISPMLPGGERASRSPGDNAEYSTTHEQTESGSDHQGAHSDTGSLSPPWEKERRVNIHTSGQHYPDPPIHPRRQEKYYPNPPISGRFSGPAELIRGYNMHSFDRADGQLSMENNLLNDSNRNGANENHSNPVNIADHTLHPDNEAVRSNFAPPPPLMRGPLLPMDPRGPFLRRIPPFPPRMMDMYGPREYFPVPEFSGIPHHPAEMRIPFPPRPYLPFPLQRPGYFPPTLPPETRSEPPTRLMPPPEALQAEDPKSQEET